MKKFLLFWLLAFAVVLTWCSEKLDKDDLFEKKQECASYKDEIDKAIEDRLKLIKNNWAYFTEENILDEIFYSSEENSCLYSVYVTQHNMFNSNVTCGFYRINDILNWNKEIRSDVKFIENDKSISCDREASEKVYKEILKKLKWEQISDL